MTTEPGLKPLWDDLPLRRYLSEVATRMGVVEILALDNLRDLPRIRIETIYVPPLLAEYAVDAEGDPKRWPAGQNLLEALTEHRRLVVLGDPSGGKTTLANWLAWRLSAGLSSPLPPFLADKVPLPCVLRELPSAVFTQETPLAGLVEHIVRRLLGDKASDELRATLHARVAAGKYVLILDGIDEIPLAARDRVRNWVRTASEQDACVLATSRIVGYDDLPVDRMTYVDRFRELFSSGQRLPPDLFARAAALGSIEAASDARFRVWHDRWADKQSIAGIAASLWAKMERDRSKRGDAGPSSLDGEAARAEFAWAARRYLMPFDDARIAAFAANWYGQRCASEIEAREKSEVLADLSIKWSIIGHLQTNKAKYLARFANEVQALDSLKVAEELDKRLQNEGRAIDVFVQVNSSGEESKFGLPPEAVRDFVQHLPQFSSLRIKGLMTLAIFSTDHDRVRECFVKMRNIQAMLRQEAPAGLSFDELSMGMSGDYELAIEEGATVVRVGQAIFGKRPLPDSHYWPGLG